MELTTGARVIMSSSTCVIENLIESRYGANALTCEPLVVEWAAEHLAKSIGKDKAAGEWKRLNARREALGKYTTIPSYTSALFAPYFERKETAIEMANAFLR